MPGLGFVPLGGDSLLFQQVEMLALQSMETQYRTALLLLSPATPHSQALNIGYKANQGSG